MKPLAYITIYGMTVVMQERESDWWQIVNPALDSTHGRPVVPYSLFRSSWPSAHHRLDPLFHSRDLYRSPLPSFTAPEVIQAAMRRRELLHENDGCQLVSHLEQLLSMPEPQAEAEVVIYLLA